LDAAASLLLERETNTNYIMQFSQACDLSIVVTTTHPCSMALRIKCAQRNDQKINALAG